MAVRLIDVASRAGVSISTVSNVLNGYTKSGIKMETVERVRAIANEMGYRPNAIARSLKNQRVETIGFHTGYGFREARDRFRAEIYTGMMRACDEFNFDFHIHGDLEGKSPREIQSRLCDGRVGGVVAYTFEEDPAARCLIDSGLPTVAIADRHSGLPSVVGSDELGVQMLVDYLWDRGHRRMRFLGPVATKESIDRRIEYFTRHLEEKGGEASFDFHPWFRSGEYLRELMEQPDRPTALCSFNDGAAYLLLRGAKNAGIRVPEDFALTGYDGLLAGDAAVWDLVTVRVPWEEMAFEAVRQVISIMDGKAVPRLTCFPVDILGGDTV